jgi:hypothetical protein
MTQALEETLAALGHLIDRRIARNDATFPSITQPLVPFTPSVQMLPRPTCPKPRSPLNLHNPAGPRRMSRNCWRHQGTPETCAGCREASADGALSSWPRCP